MKIRAMVVTAGMGLVLSFNAPCPADFISVEIEEHATVTTAAGPRIVYRLYARFSEGDDRVTSWGGMQSSAVNIHTGPCTGSAFFQAPNGNTAPSQETINKLPDSQWDTFATIGVNIAEQGVPSDQTSLSLGFPTFISGHTFNSTSALALVPPDSPQARADFAGDGDLQHRVLLAQLTTIPDNYPYGRIGVVNWRNGSGQSFQNTQQTWIGPAAHGRCCLPTGACAITYHSGCAQFLNGYFLDCEPCDTCAITCVPDIVPHPGDGMVNIDDLLAVVNAWGPCSPWDTCPPDVSPAFGDDVVNIDDLLAVINGWGACK